MRIWKKALVRCVLCRFSRWCIQRNE
jgi:hypothetical protein